MSVGNIPDRQAVVCRISQLETPCTIQPPDPIRHPSIPSLALGATRASSRLLILNPGPNANQTASWSQSRNRRNGSTGGRGYAASAKQYLARFSAGLGCRERLAAQRQRDGGGSGGRCDLLAAINPGVPYPGLSVPGASWRSSGASRAPAICFGPRAVSPRFQRAPRHRRTGASTFFAASSHGGGAAVSSAAAGGRILGVAPARDPARP